MCELWCGAKFRSSTPWEDFKIIPGLQEGDHRPHVQFSLLWEEWLIVISLLWNIRRQLGICCLRKDRVFSVAGQVLCWVLLRANHSQEEVLLFAWGAQDLLRGSDCPWNSKLNESVGSGWTGPKACSWHRQRVFWDNYLEGRRDRTGSLLCPGYARISDHSRPEHASKGAYQGTRVLEAGRCQDVVLRALTSPNGPSKWPTSHSHLTLQGG